MFFIVFDFFFLINSIRFDEECWNERMSKQIPSFQSITTKNGVAERKRGYWNVYSYRIWYLERGVERISMDFRAFKSRKKIKWNASETSQEVFEGGIYQFADERTRNIDIFTLNSPISHKERAWTTNNACKINPMEKPDLLHWWKQTRKAATHFERNDRNDESHILFTR